MIYVCFTPESGHSDLSVLIWLLEDFAKQSFGIFHEDPFDVVWKFSPRAAKAAKDFVFHPDQKIQQQNDGSLTVRSRAGDGDFFIGSHDRGARVAHRLALDFPDRVRKLAVLDIVPTIEHFERADMSFAMGYYHWFWFAQRHPFPESVINVVPEVWFRAHTSREPKGGNFFHADALADYLAAVRNPEMIRGMCEDYRAAATIDLDHDSESREAGEKIRCSLLVLWGAKGKIGEWYEPLDIWRRYCEAEVVGGPVNSGHYLAEEAPDEVLERFFAFFE